MDSIINGEVSDENKAKISDSVPKQEGINITKPIDVDTSETESQEVGNDPVSNPSDKNSATNGGDSSAKEVLSLDSEKNSVSPSKIAEGTKVAISNDKENTLLSKENGPSNSLFKDINEVKSSNDSSLNQSSNVKTDVNASPTKNLHETSAGEVFRDLASSESSDSNSLTTCAISDLNTSSSKLTVKTDFVSSSTDESAPLNEHLKEKHSNNSKNDSIEVLNESEVEITKNHVVETNSGCSEENLVKDIKAAKISSETNSGDKTAELPKNISKGSSESKTGSNVSDNNSAVNSSQVSGDQPLNFSTTKEQMSSHKTTSESNSSKNTYDVNNLVDLSVNKWPQENPLEKLNEHLKNIGADKEQIPFNHSPKSHASSNASFPKETTAKTHSHVVCDKENKITDSHLHDRGSKDSSDSFVYAELSQEETGFPDVFTGLVTIGKYISVKGDFTLRSTEALVESPSLVAPYLLKEPDSFPPREKEPKSEVKDFFHSAAGEILIGIGISRVNEWFHRDMMRIKKRQMKKGGKTPELEDDLKMHENLFIEAKKANNVYSFSFKTCKTCGFTSESAIVMEGHLLVPHITQRREYQCNFCETINRDPKGMLEHMIKVHGKVGRIQPPVLFFECPYCSYESNSKVKLNNHLVKCQRYFDHGINQAPPKDFEFPALTPKPITVAVVKAYEKSLGSMQRGRGRPKKDISDSMHMNQFTGNANLPPLAPNHLPAFRASSNSPLADSLSMQNQIIPPIQMPNMNIRPAHANAMGQLRPAISHMHMPPPNRFFHFVNPSGQIMPLMGNNHLVTSPSQFPFSPSVDSGGQNKKTPSVPNFNSMIGSNLRPNSPKGMSSVTITPLPKLQGPYPVPMAKPTTASGSTSMQSNSLVVCEICDGYIKDLEQLRTHMQLIHKVKIHPKMLVSRPPLNCQKCQWRFFTDQGLERHLLGAHGLVTSNMQELANKGKDAGCCTICGRVYASKLVSHMNQVHKITLKPAHLSYKCTVCSATFNLYRLFENHVYLVHSGAAKRSADGRSSPSKRIKTSGDSLADVESSNHKEKTFSKDIGDENVNKCKECGEDIGSDQKSQNEKCEKCLKSGELVQGTISTKTLTDELRKKDKTIEKAAA